jgi:hypothetical protein
MAEAFEVNLQDLTLAEIELFEELTGLPFDEAFAKGAPKAKALRGIAVVSKRRTEPDFTWEQAGDMVLNVSDAEPTPTEPAAS